MEGAIALGLLLYWIVNGNPQILIASGLFAIAANIALILEKGKEE